MPGTSTQFRVLIASMTVLLGMTGCQTLNDAGQVIGRADLVNELAARMDRAMGLTYSADYQLAGGQNAAIAQAQKPSRSAYSYPGGKVTVTQEAAAECDTSGGQATCTLIPTPIPSNRPSVTVFKEANERGMVTPPVVMNLLTTVALDPAAVIEPSDTTVAGLHATCVQIKELSSGDTAPFEACVTSEGVLGNFKGTIDGKPIEVALTRYREAVDSNAFELPTGAKIIDQRPSKQ